MNEGTLMPEIEITVQHVNWPKEGKKLGSIKSSEGIYYGADPGMLTKFRQGEVATIEYSETPKRDGDGTWKNIKRKISSLPPVVGNAKSTPVGRGEMRQRTHPVDSEQMFIGCFINAGWFSKEQSTSDMVADVNQLRDVYRLTFGGSEAQRDDEMRDEIPYTVEE